MTIKGTHSENNELKAVVKDFLARYGSTITFIAKQIGLSRQYIGRWLNEEELSLSREHLDNIREVVGLPRLYAWEEYEA